MFNADLALSVTMTATSSVLSVIMLPLNLLMYASTMYNEEILKNLDYFSLVMALLVVITAINTGLFCSAKWRSPRLSRLANKVSFCNLFFLEPRFF